MNVLRVSHRGEPFALVFSALSRTVMVFRIGHIIPMGDFVCTSDTNFLVGQTVLREVTECLDLLLAQESVGRILAGAR